jgi:3-oxoacyl-[acyl-carrier-protein] synthase-3
LRIDLKGYKFLGTGSAFPLNAVTNESLATYAPINPDWTSSTLGVEERRYLADGESLSELALSASRKAISSSGGRVIPDLVIVATSTPEYINPSMACILHEALGLPEESPAFDIQAVCNGFLYATSVAASLLNTSGKETALIVGADQFSKITDFDSRNSVYFGDGAAAAVLAKDSKSGSDMILDLYANGTDWRHFHTKSIESKFEMQANGVARIVNSKVPKAIFKLLGDYGLSVLDVDHFVTHQPSKGVLDNLESQLGIPSSKLKRNYATNGNTAGATVPSILDLIRRDITPNSLVCYVSFGSGWTWTVGLIGRIRKN